MKIGIVTFWWSQDNYGQLLQCFASQKYLQKLGHDAFLIRVRNFLEEPSDTYPSMPIWRKLLSCKHWFFFFHSLYRKYYHSYVNKHIQNHLVDRQFDVFRDKYIVSTERVYTHEELLHDFPEVDILASGSDMIWGIGLHHHEYLLDFGRPETKRISIAASFGRTWETLTPTEKETYKRYIGRFDSITLREDEGVTICHNLGLKDAVRICDPTMLLDRFVYEELMKSAVIPECHDRAFVYYIGSDPSCLTDKEIILVLKNCGLDYYYAPSVSINAIPKVFPTIEQWLSYIRDSRFVVTNSFHGTIFCLLFHKQFAVVPLKLEQRNTRIFSLLKEVGLENRICRTKHDLANCIKSSINYDVVSQSYEDFVARSRAILNQCL